MTDRFDLLTQPWIRVRLLSGDVVELSLTDALVRAHECADLAGELPTQDAAVLRLLLAVLHRAHPDAETPDDWAALWTRGQLDPAPLHSYLDRHRDRFDLLHPQTPFFQVAELRTAKGEFTELARIVADVPAGHQLFTTRSGSELQAMSYAEAARWVVHCQAFDASGIKSGAVGDDRVKGGRGYPIGVAWCGWLGLVVVEGGTLFETLLLNLVLRLRPLDAPEDLPVWERPPQGPAAEGRSAPAGPVDLLTWQSRRIRLQHDGVQATGVLICNGDALHPRNRFAEETMTSWRYSQAQTKAQGSESPVFMPRQHLADRALWRGLAGLLPEALDDTGGPTRTGGWLDWLSTLRGDGVLPDDHPVRLRAVGMEYGAQSSVTDDIIDDRLALRLPVLTDPQLRAAAVTAVQDADHAVTSLGRLAAELAEAAGATRTEAESAVSRAREEGYEALDAPYRRWLFDLRGGADPGVERTHWQVVVRTVVASVARGLVQGAGDAAWMGREVRRGPDRVVFLNAALAELHFFAGLARALPLALTPLPAGGAR